MNNPVQQAILDRRSTRGFTAEQLTEEQLSALVDAALASPTARNAQTWHFTVVQNQALLDALNADLTDIIVANKPAGSRGRFEESGFQVFYHAPTVIFIAAPEHTDNRFAQIDVGIAAENIALAAQGMGLGSVIIGLVKDVFESDRETYYNKALDFPEGYRFAIAVSVGHNTVTKDAHPIGENKVSYVR